MTRIYCAQPSTGKPINAIAQDVPTTWTTIADAPDFSVPDPSGNLYPNRDPLDPSRGIAPGEIFFLTPLMCTNKTATASTIEVRFYSETGFINYALGSALVPAGATAMIPLQGRSLVKRDPNATYGDRLQVQATDANTFDVWASASEQASAENVGVFTP
jgi:hypothetical protein